ncbi:MAG: TetR/AcrR family transcriptional regulator C-terminal domain-containing protein [Hyphomicrobiaceae bacterium]|nr:TetR/AcrR family transcriptional regulator C-terminal domain-containing protein [Hyphomicrobiaceae bacterium]
MAGRTGKGTAGRRTARASLTRDAVVQAAILFADERGLDVLSMRKLAEAVGVEAMSLYNHVTSKDDLLDGMVDAAVAEIELPTIGSDWMAAMRARAISAHEMLLRHAWASMLIVSRINVGPAMLRYADATIGCLREAGFSYAMADHAMNALDSHIYGFTLLKANFPLEPSEYAEAARQFLPMLPAETYTHARGLAEKVISGRHSGINEFTFGLDLLLDGLDRLRARPLARSRTPRRRKARSRSAQSAR